ncbi:heavy metal translocating P-type ATPase [Paenibacillus sp. DYY-L-2]|uniref:heavy metal translocating P-type ATPase n=1 Tax=Paenibacillus sp. DYY-L-2 TaxID=3447013 RepID=UPI003F504603
MNARQSSYATLISGLWLLAAAALHLAGWIPWRQAALLFATLTAGIPIAIRAYQALRGKAFSIELLVSIAVVGALYLGEYVESAAVTFLFLFGGYLESRTLEKTRSSLKALLDMAPDEANVVRDGKPIRVPAETVEVGDRLLIRSGEKVAVDGRIVSGSAAMDESAVTGEAVPVNKSVHDSVFSGTIVDNGYIEVVAEKVGGDTSFARMIELVEEAQEAKSKTQQFMDRFARVYTPAAVLLSILVLAVTGKPETAITFLVIACPGALVIGAPVSVVSGIGNGARHGVLIKGGEVMERLSRIDTVVFDKTGTLTTGKPEVTSIHAFCRDENELLSLAAGAEAVSEHHLGRAIMNEAEKRNLAYDGARPEWAEIIKGSGIRVTKGGNTLAVGNRKLMNAEGIDIGREAEALAENLEQQGNTVVYMAIGGQLEGLLAIADRLRPEAEQAVRDLRQAGIRKILMLTGDNRHAAGIIGSKLELDEVHAGVMPEGKSALIKALKDAGKRVAMAGDGINDAPAIATADIGLAMGEGGTDIAMETADVVLMADRLNQFSYAYSLSKATVRNMRQNMFIAIATVAVLLLGVLTGKVYLASGMFIHELSVLLVVLNAVRLGRYQKNTRNKKKGDGYVGRNSQLRSPRYE